MTAGRAQAAVTGRDVLGDHRRWLDDRGSDRNEQHQAATNVTPAHPARPRRVIRRGRYWHLLIAGPPLCAVSVVGTQFTNQTTRRKSLCPSALRASRSAEVLGLAAMPARHPQRYGGCMRTVGQSGRPDGVAWSGDCQLDEGDRTSSGHAIESIP